MVVFKITWGIIGVWSLIGFVSIIIDWVRWNPTDKTLGGALISVFKYRFGMMLKMIIPAFLIIASLMVFAS